MNRLITYAYLKEETDISSLVDSKELDNPIKWAQDQLKFQLGTLFYNEIYAQGTTSPTSFSTANAALFDPYIKQFLAWTAYHDYRTNSNFYDSRNGPREWKEENSDPASRETLNFLVRQASDKVQFYKGNMINYIIQQQNASVANFPLYKTDCGNKFGNGFGITGVKKLSTSQRDLTQRTIQNGY